jgi:hypothetical protein
MKDRAEYLQIAVEKRAVKDLQSFCALLYDYLLKNSDRQFLNRIRPLEFFCSEEGDFLYLDAFVGARPLIAFQQTKATRGFFVDTIQHIVRFARFFSIQPRLVFFSDAISRLDANRQQEIWELEQLNSARMRPGKAVVLSCSNSFFFCVFEAQHNDSGNEKCFFANAVLFCSSAEATALIECHLARDKAKLIELVEVTPTAPMHSVPGFDCVSCDWEVPKVLHVSGKAYYG